MKLEIKKIYPGLRAHTLINGDIIASNGYTIYKIQNQNDGKIKLNEIPNQFIKKNLSNSRIFSRGLRLGISQIKKIFDDRVLIFCNKALLLSDVQFSEFKHIDIPIKCFQLMDHNICATDNYVYYSEYFPNKKRDEVRIFKSENGTDWDVIYKFPMGSIKHIHVLQNDPYTDKIWFSTVDNNDESMIGYASYDFSNLKIIGKGEQKWRTIEFHFAEDTVYWGMDSEIERSFLVKYDRNTKKTKLIGKFDGPIYNLKKVCKGYYLIGTTVEGGPAKTDDQAHIWLSTDLCQWKDVISYKKDIFPYFMGYGRLIFPGEMENMVIFSGQGLKDIDNKLIIGEIV
jgi:hypothetical protein